MTSAASARSVCIDARTMPTYDLGPAHPWASDRQLGLLELCEVTGLLTKDDYFATTPASRQELLSVHHERYVEALEALDGESPDTEARRNGLVHGLGSSDNPVLPGQFRAASAVAGATRDLVRALMRGEVLRAFQPTGGLHHAMPEAASGFCLLNDLALGIRLAREMGAKRVAYVDFDVHHGDGVERVFRDDPDVLTVSFHEDPHTRWPHTGRVEDLGRGDARLSTVNMPLAPGTTDTSFVSVCDRVLDAVFERFQPDLLVTQHGCDPHIDDPLADLSVGTAVFLANARTSRRLADQYCGGRWLATGGGGYRPYTVLPRAWALVWSVVAGREVPEHTPESWRRSWHERTGKEMPERFVDPEPTDRRAEAAARTNEETLGRLFELHELGS